MTAKPRVRINARNEISAINGFSVPPGVYGRGRRDAARHDISELNGWSPGIAYAGSDYFGDMATIMGRSRDLDANNAWINGGLDRRVEAVVGGNIRLSAQPVYQLFNRDYAWRVKWAADTQPRFKVWANDIDRRCDARMMLSFGAMVKLAYLTYIRDGEACGEIRDDYRGIPNPTNVLLIEPERISNPQDRALTEGPQLRNGITYDKNGAPTGYWVASRHQNDPTPGVEPIRWEWIPIRGKTGRRKFLHVFNPRHVAQNRGISRLAEAMVPAKMIDRVDRAEVEAALKSAILSFFIKSPGTTKDLEDALASADDGTADAWISDYVQYRKEAPIRLEGASIVHLLPEEDVVTPSRNSPNANYPDFVRFVLQKIAGSLGISYPQLSQDWAGINYSSARALLNELWRSFLEDRHFFTQAFCTPIYAAWLEMEVANGDIKIPGGPANFYRLKTAITMAEWIGPGRGSVDPLKEANANNLDTAAGRTSTVQHILEAGRDPEDVMNEEAWYLQSRADRSLAVPNHNVKADAAGSDAADGNGGTEQDHDGDGIPLEDKKRKPMEQPA